MEKGSSSKREVDLENLTGTREFAYLETMDMVLELASDFINSARNAEDDHRLGIFLKMLSRCARCAMEMYGEQQEALTREMH